MLRIALVACAKRKSRHAAPAKDLYASPLFRLTRRLVETDPGYFAWYVLSAKHGLVDPDETLEPYDTTLASLSRAERARWAERVAHEVNALYGGAIERGIHVEVAVFAGARYREGLAPLLTRAGFCVRVPLAGLGIGKQLAWLNHRVARPLPGWPEP